MCIWLGFVNLRSHESINTYTNIQRGQNSFRLHSLSLLSQSGWGRLLLKKFLWCLRRPPKLEDRCVTRKRTDEKESGSRKCEKDRSFFLKHVQGLKDSPAHPYRNFPQVPPTPHPPAPQPRIKTRIFVEQHPDTSFVSPGILDFRLIVTSYVSGCVSWHTLSYH